MIGPFLSWGSAAEYPGEQALPVCVGRIDFFLAVLPVAPLRCGDRLFHHRHMLAASSPGGLGAGAALYCSTHDGFLPYVAITIYPSGYMADYTPVGIMEVNNIKERSHMS